MLIFHYDNYCKHEKVVHMQSITQEEREILARSMSQFRRSIIRKFVASIIHAFGDFDFSLPQMATLLLLDEEGEMTIKQVAEYLGRSVSATRSLPKLWCGFSATS